MKKLLDMIFLELFLDFATFCIFQIFRDDLRCRAIIPGCRQRPRRPMPRCLGAGVPGGPVDLLDRQEDPDEAAGLGLGVEVPTAAHHGGTPPPTAFGGGAWEGRGEVITGLKIGKMEEGIETGGRNCRHNPSHWRLAGKGRRREA